MITLDQILVLQEKVKAAVERINRLEKENAQLRAQLEASTNNNQSLSIKVSNYEAEQNQIEAQILQVLNALNTVEDTVRQELRDEEPEESITSTVVEESNPELFNEEIPDTQTTAIPSEITNESVEQVGQDFPATDDENIDQPAFIEATQEEMQMFTANSEPAVPAFDTVPSPESNGQLDIF